jgi:hypothetical protein
MMKKKIISFVTLARLAAALMLLIGGGGVSVEAAVPVEAKFGQVQCELLDVYGRSACNTYLRSIGQEEEDTTVFEEVVVCYSVDTDSPSYNTTLSGRVEWLNLNLASLEECSLLDTGSSSCIDMLFEGSMAVSCTAIVDGSTCECEICETLSGAVGTKVTCIDDSTEMSQCEANSILEGASQRNGSFPAMMGFQGISETLQEYFNFSCGITTGKANVTSNTSSLSTFHVKEEIVCSEPFFSGTAIGSAQSVGVNFPTNLATRTFEVTNRRQGVVSSTSTTLFFDDGGSLIDACSEVEDNEPCESCEVCTAENGGIGVRTICRGESSDCESYPILNPGYDQSCALSMSAGIVSSFILLAAHLL